MNKIQHIFFFILLLALLSLGGEALSVVDGNCLPMLAESQESVEEEEGSIKTNAYKDARIRQAGAGGSDLNEKDKHSPFQNNLFPALSTTRFTLPISDVAFPFHFYNNALLSSLAFPKLYILFQCSKAFLI